MTEEMLAWDERWGDAARKALTQTKTKIHRVARKKLDTLLKWNELNDIVEREARCLILRWKTVAKGEGKKAEVAKAALKQVAEMRLSSPLREAARLEDKLGEDKSERLLQKWNIMAAHRTAGRESRGPRGGRGSRRPPHVMGRKLFPRWLGAGSTLSTGMKRSPLRCFCTGYLIGGHHCYGRRAHSDYCKRRR